MLKELLSVFRSIEPLAKLANNFGTMLRLSYDLTVRAGESYFGEPATAEQRTKIYKQDVKVNKLERKIRKRVIAHLSLQTNTADVPYCLLLMSLVKDAERIGDYAKNLSEVRELHPEPLPESDILAELREIRSGVESGFAATSDVFARSGREEAAELIREGRAIAHRGDALLAAIARSPFPADTTTAFVLAARYYKRINGHILNILSSVVMPLHKLDYYDERELEETEAS